MSRNIILLSTFIALIACTTSKESASLRAERRNEQRMAEEVAVRKAIESRQYVLRMDRIFLSGGEVIEIVPRNNFIIVNGEIISVSLAYAGRSFGIRQITGINFNGRTGKYLMKSDEAKGVYNIEVEAITQNNDKFDLYLTLGSNGSCTASVNNPYIQTVNYHGTILPLSTLKVSVPRPQYGI
ncbi:MAG: DUF4251 domain-containing protein [Bacteroidales bacterium]